jgi:Protein of unknown function (DUF721).
MAKSSERRNRAPGENALAWLDRDTRGAGVLATARRYMQMKQAVQAALPGPLGEVCQVVRLENGRATLAVPSAAHAAKLRQLAPRIAEALTRRGWNVNEIAVQVQAGMPGYGPRERPAREVVPLEGAGLQAFAELHGKLRPGALADAVARLLARHGKA